MSETSQNRRLNVPADLSIPAATVRLLNLVSLELAEDDGMYAGNDSHYLSCGASAVNAILAAQQLAGAAAPGNVLDFGAGAGRVTRWLRAAFPETQLAACDLRKQDMAFLARSFGVEAWVSGTDIAALNARTTYDLIWLGSVATHLSAENVERLFDKMLSWTAPGGLLVMSLHGRFAYERQESGSFQYIHDEGWREITEGYNTLGFGYADYKGAQGYGISLTKLSWTAALVETRPDVRLVTLAEKVWDDHHDVLAVKRLA